MIIHPKDIDWYNGCVSYKDNHDMSKNTIAMYVVSDTPELTCDFSKHGLWLVYVVNDLSTYWPLEIMIPIFQFDSFPSDAIIRPNGTWEKHITLSANTFTFFVDERVEKTYDTTHLTVINREIFGRNWKDIVADFDINVIVEC